MKLAFICGLAATFVPNALSLSLSRRRVCGGLAGALSLTTNPLSSPAVQTPPTLPQSSNQPPTQPSPPEWTQKVRDDPRLDFSVYAVTNSQGVPLVAVDLDFSGRARTAAYFFEAKSEAEHALSLALNESPDVAKGCVVTEVPFSEALGLLYTPPFKVTGLPGYYCWRFKKSEALIADALSLSGLETLSELVIPVFLSKSQSGADSGAVFMQLADLEKAAGLKHSSSGGGSSSTVSVTDLRQIVKSWAQIATATAEEKAADSGGTFAAAEKVVRVVPPKSQRGSGNKAGTSPRRYRPAEHLLALEWSV
mmetsp:Transcript_64372/g.126375  ORF Transcript_64372/g.126375 Transcript_64372/m.126375 type:complete len:308 (-) Transcript_64372:243-1166(-)